MRFQVEEGEGERGKGGRGRKSGPVPTPWPAVLRTAVPTLWPAVLRTAVPTLWPAVLRTAWGSQAFSIIIKKKKLGDVSARALPSLPPHDPSDPARHGRRGAFLLSRGQKKKLGDVLLSHPKAVPSALKGLTSVFGMGTGGTPSLRSPSNIYLFLRSNRPAGGTPPNRRSAPSGGFAVRRGKG